VTILGVLLVPAAAQEAPSVQGPSNAVADDPVQDFCERWRKMGTLYSDPGNSPIQEFKTFGRIHYQYGVVDGTSPEGDFDYSSAELRRFRLGVSSKFLNVFDLFAEGEFGDDGRPRGGDFDVGYQHMWQLKLQMDAKEVLGTDGVDGLKFGIGSREINMSYEWVTSSKRIKTVERSAISNKIWAFNSDFANPTGAWVTTELDPVTWTLGAFSTTQDQTLAGFDDGELYYTNLLWDLHEGPDGEDTDLRWTAFYQDRGPNDEVLASGLDWATALSVQHKEGPWEFHAEGITGNNGDQSSASREGSFWGAVFMPSYWIQKDSLEAVANLQYQGSEEAQGIRLNSRYVRRAGVRDGIPSLSNGRGDEHYSVYTGVNKLFCGHQHKVMLGVQYDNLNREGTEIFDGWSLLVAYRTYW
jgi:hypothetical protein